MKRFVSLLLALIFLLGTCLGLVSCSRENLMTRGEYLSLLCETFGMDSYQSTEPYTKHADASNPAFGAVQAAYEWGVVTEEDLKINTLVTEGFLAETLLRRVGTVALTEEMSQREILKKASREGYLSFETKRPKKKVDRANIQASLALAYEIWQNPNFEHQEHIEVKDSVKDLTSLSPSEVLFNDDQTQVALPASAAQGLTAGDLYLLPKTDSGSYQACKVDSIRYEGDTAIIENSSAEIQPEEFLEEFEFSQNFTPDFSSVPITDGAGNVINPEVLEGEGNYQSTSFVSGSPILQNCAKKKNNYSFNYEIDDLSISGEVDIPTGNISFHFKGALQKPDSDIKLDVEKNYEIKDLSIPVDYELKPFSLKPEYVYVNVQYTLVDDLTLSTDFEKSVEKEFDKTLWPGLSDVLTSDEISDSEAGVAKEIEILKFPMLSALGLVNLNVIVKAEISFSGSIKISLTTAHSEAFEYRNGNFTTFKKTPKEDFNLEINAKAEFTAFLGISLDICRAIDLVSFGLKAGIGIEAVVWVHLVSEENKLMDQLDYSGSGDYLNQIGKTPTYFDGTQERTTRMEYCLGIETYWILNLKISSGMLAKVINFDGKTFELIKGDARKIKALSGHIENGSFVEECTRNYEKEEIPQIKEDDLFEADTLAISDSSLTLPLHQSHTLTFDSLPPETTIGDLTFESSDISIASVCPSGVIHAGRVGTATITVTAPDGQTQSCVVFVTDAAESSATGGGGSR